MPIQALYATNEKQAATEAFGGADAVLQQRSKSIRASHPQETFVCHGNQFPSTIPFSKVKRRVNLYRCRFDFSGTYQFADQPRTLIFFSNERNPAFVGFLTGFLLTLGIGDGLDRIGRYQKRQLLSGLWLWVDFTCADQHKIRYSSRWSA